MSNETSTPAGTAAFVLQLLGAGAGELGKVEGPFGLVATAIGGALSIAAMIVKAANGDPIKIEEMRDGIARKLAVDAAVDKWTDEHIRVPQAPPKVTVSSTMHVSGKADSHERVLTQDIVELRAAAQDLLNLATGYGHEPHRERVKRAGERLRAAIAMVVA